uniref:Uncharacterized protein n=1 Tax=Arundo donax TaxID=35708 RepID=A0A0A9C5F1_ARUDO
MAARHWSWLKAAHRWSRYVACHQISFASSSGHCPPWMASMSAGLLREKPAPCWWWNRRRGGRCLLPSWRCVPSDSLPAGDSFRSTGSPAAATYS